MSKARPETVTKKASRIKQPDEKCCLIVGFDAFGSAGFNPSQYIVDTLPANIKGKRALSKVSVNTLILPVTGPMAWKLLQSTLKKMKPSVLIMTGLFQIRSLLSIERFALNMADYRIKDNLGRMPKDQPIDKGGPNALMTNVNVRELANCLLKKGFPSEVSNYAGTFICNEIYYNALRFQQKFRYPQTVLFMHVPAPGKFGRSLRALGTKKAEKMAAGRKNQLNAMREAVIQVMVACCC